MSPHSPTPIGIEKALDAVHYGIDQLSAMVGVETKDRNLDNAIVESRLLHARTLIDFFEEIPRIKDDILATNYGFPIASLPIEKDVRDRLDKDLAHLTYSRTKRTDADKLWPHDCVVRPVLERCRSFIDHVLASRSTYSKHGRTDWEDLRTRVTNVIVAMTTDLPVQRDVRQRRGIAGAGRLERPVSRSASSGRDNSDPAVALLLP